MLDIKLFTKKNEKYRHVRYRAGMRLVRYSYEIGGVSRK